ncbi:hypothetical protein C8F04DRAFT_1078271 [Mycena alexandri]|uniref:F-box domain-containing protein n=1 Tax=Mycena alexandri TaxID=1745969 RepID=A0AAD6TAM2_9AGAR|nr:hypothetical protein C8F04DRAFT_1078271 [Mycena alexandri]
MLEFALGPNSMDATEGVEDTLNRLQTEISCLESDKSTLLIQLERLNSSLSRLKARYGTVKNRTALVGGLPNEILAKVFEAGRDLDVPGAQHFEVLASHVVSMWREIAITTPSLWSILEVSPSTSSDKLKTYIARAKACSLELRFNFAQEVWVPDQFVWETILPTVDQWRSLVISTGPDESALYTTLAHLESLRASLLEEISIKRGDSSSMAPATGGHHGFLNSAHCFHAGAPLLKILRLEGTYLSSNWPPLTSISTLDLHHLRRSTRPSWNRFRDLLVSSLQLSSLSIYGDVVAGKPGSNLEIELPNLRSLRIRGTTPLGNRASDLLLTLSAPNLRSLTLFDIIYTDLDPFLDGSQLFQSLTSLTLYWPNFLRTTYIRLFETMPSISHLTLMHRKPEEFLALLRDPLAPSFFPCPHLIDFALYPGNPHEGYLEDIVLNRAVHVPLQVLRLGMHADVPGVQVLPFDLPPSWPAWPEQL